MTKANETFEKVTAQIVSALRKADPNDWRAPWHSVGGGGFIPTNALTGKAYKGVNVLILWSRAEVSGYPVGKWATYKQWQKLGAQVRKGERGEACVKWIVKDKYENGKPVIGPDGKPETVAFPSGFTLFNAAQVDGYDVEAPVIELPDGVTPIEHAETFFEKCGATIKVGGNRAFYATVQDYIGLPEVEKFTSTEGYYATVGHEHVHWTGHDSRLKRPKHVRWGDESYAFEELVAELGAAFLCAHLGIANEPRPDHAQHLASWLKKLSDDPTAIQRAASQASKAVDYLLNLAGESDDVAPADVEETADA